MIGKRIKKTFGIKNIILSLIIYTLLGIYNSERIKGLRTMEAGILLGLKSLPCCKTFRNGLKMLSDENFAEYFNREMRRNYVRLGYVKLGLMYFDGHFIPYYGNKKVYKGYSTQRRLALRGHYQNFITDSNGNPVLFYVNNSFVKFADVLITSIQDIKELMNEFNTKEPLILVFDREGYNFNLLKKLDALKIGYILYRKNNKNYELSKFDKYVYYKDDRNKKVSYRAYTHTLDLKGYRDDVPALSIYNKQTDSQATIINNLERVGIKMSNNSIVKFLDGRWRIENFFKQAKIQVGLDHQYGYEIESSGEGENSFIVANPHHTALVDEIEKTDRLKIKMEKKLQRAIDHNYNLKRKRIEPNVFLKNEEIVKLKKVIATIKRKKTNLIKKALEIPEIVAFEDIKSEDKDVLKTTKSSVILQVKTAVFNFKKEFTRDCLKYFTDLNEIDKFIMQLTDGSAKITITDKYWVVKIQRLETPRYQKAAELLIEFLNTKNTTVLDGSGKKIIYQF